MGFHAAAFVFDYRRYRNCVVPPLRRALATGELGPWLTEVWRTAHGGRHGRPVPPFIRPPEPPNPTVTYLGPDLDVSGAETDCRFVLETCGERSTANLQYYIYDRLVRWICLKDWVGMRRLSAQYLFRSLAEEAGLEVTDRLTELMHRLGTCGSRAWNYGSEGSVHGWLTPEQTAEAVELLERLPIPAAPSDLLEARFWDLPDQQADEAEPYYLHEERALIARLTTLCRSASASGHGVLWGRDIELLWGWTPPDLREFGETVVGTARQLADAGTFGNLPVLADALEEAGCTDPMVLAHCRDCVGHQDGCWVVDQILDPARPVPD